MIIEMPLHLSIACAVLDADSCFVHYTEAGGHIGIDKVVINDNDIVDSLTAYDLELLSEELEQLIDLHPEED